MQTFGGRSRQSNAPLYRTSTSRHVEIIQWASYHWIQMNKHIVVRAMEGRTGQINEQVEKEERHLTCQVQSRKRVKRGDSCPCVLLPKPDREQRRRNGWPAWIHSRSISASKLKFQSTLSNGTDYERPSTYPVMLRQSGSRRICAKLVTSKVVSHPSLPCTKTDVSNQVELKEGIWRRMRSVYLHSRFLELRCRPLSMLLSHEATNYYCLISITIYPCRIDRHTLNRIDTLILNPLVGLSAFVPSISFKKDSCKMFRFSRLRCCRIQRA